MGITFYEMVAHEHPFSNPRVQELVKRIQSGEAVEAKQQKKSKLQRSNTKDMANAKIKAHNNSNAMYKSTRMKKKARKDKDKKGQLDLVGVVERDGASMAFVDENSHLREAKDFFKVASKFSNNEKFVEKFEELAVAVTSDPIQVSFRAVVSFI